MAPPFQPEHLSITPLYILKAEYSVTSTAPDTEIQFTHSVIRPPYICLLYTSYMVGATSLILPVFNISICIAGLAGVGGGSLVSRLLGQGREDEARRVSTFSLYLGLAISCLLYTSRCV